MPLILAAPKRAGKSSRGTPRLRRPQRQCMALRALLQGTAALAEAFCALAGRFLGCCLDFVCCHDAIAAVSRFRRQGRRPRVFGLAGFRPALTNTRSSVANCGQPLALVLPIAALTRP